MAQSPLVRLAPLQIGELPDHPQFQKAESAATQRPDLVAFLRKFLDDGNFFVNDQRFNIAFNAHSVRPAPPANNNVQILTYDVSTADLEKVKWTETKIPGFQRSKPRQLPTEHWFARRSQHLNKSTKLNRSTASWNEFVYGLRDDHSKREGDFTPTIYDAHHVLDWNQEIKGYLPGGKLESGNPETPGVEYTNIELAVYEMCHALPWPMAPRCFPVLVATASTCPTRFVAVTVPVNLSSFDGAFYSNGRHKTEGTNKEQKKDVTIGQYAAVESVSLYTQEKNGHPGEKEEFIQWVMATASDAKGNLPMGIQKSSMPGQLPKDVSHFLKWIHNVEEGEISNSKSPVLEAR